MALKADSGAEAADSEAPMWHDHREGGRHPILERSDEGERGMQGRA